MIQPQIKAFQPTGEEVELAQVVTPPPAQAEAPALQAQVKPAVETPSVVAQVKPAAETPAATAAEPSSRTAPATTLPETSTNLPQIAAIGFLALASALAIRAVRKRIA